MSLKQCNNQPTVKHGNAEVRPDLSRGMCGRAIQDGSPFLLKLPVNQKRINHGGWGFFQLRVYEDYRIYLRQPSILPVIYLRQDFFRDLADHFRRCPEPINILCLLTDFSCRKPSSVHVYDFLLDF